MKTMTVKNMPQKLYERLKNSARSNHRSLNSEIIVCIENALHVRNVDPADLLADISRLRMADTGLPLDDEFLLAARDEGRP